jgi:periplasmic protein TonB
MVGGVHHGRKIFAIEELLPRATRRTGGEALQKQHFLFVNQINSETKKRPHIILPPPKVEPLHEAFAEAILENAFARQPRAPLDWLVSLAVHVSIFSALLILPLYYTTGLDFRKLYVTVLAAPLTPPAAPPPAPLTSSAAHRVHAIPMRSYVAGKLTAPSFIPKAIAPMSAEAAPPEEDLVGVPGGVPGGIPGGVLGGLNLGILGNAVKAQSAPSIGDGPRQPVRVGGDVKPPRLLFAPDPEYPALAKQARISGLVVIEAIIDEQGNVTGMRAVSGHPLLISAALKAVSKRKYQPTILDGEPTPLALRVEITFHF